MTTTRTTYALGDDRIVSETCGVAVSARAVHVAVLIGDGVWDESSLDLVDASGYADLLDDWAAASDRPYRTLAVTGDAGDFAIEPGGPFDDADVLYVDRDEAVEALIDSDERLATAPGVVVVDIGSEQTWCRLFEVGATGFEPRSQARTLTFGGDDLDLVVRDVVVDKGLVEWPPQPGAEGEYDQFFENVKKSLVDSTAVRASGDGRLIIDRAEFQLGARPFLETLTDFVGGLVDSTGDHVPTLYFLGGTSLLPPVTSAVETGLALDAVVAANPTAALARGAALVALARPVFEPPVFEPPVVEPPVVEPPVVEPQLLEPPVLEPRPLETPLVDPLPVEPESEVVAPAAPVVVAPATVPVLDDVAGPARTRRITKEMLVLAAAILLYGVVAFAILLTA